ncbi:hypothetical protein [Bacilliculturomica massiliensis]|uniref:hypothetical protein n=1 Tax=Bacilliculturomica massiliensis TaxID=1917867 RepID=UPI001FE5E38B|nr:hypothetical protein [Bacilliculturomica massiliensis]
MLQTEREGSTEKKRAEKKSESATFTIKIQFARNATWQGSISWLEGQKTRNFRSELELMKLMAEAAPCEEELADW